MFLLDKNIPCFFSYESERLAPLSRLKDPLEELAKHIDLKLSLPILTAFAPMPNFKN
jgi:hypothetical protein